MAQSAIIARAHTYRAKLAAGVPLAIALAAALTLAGCGRKGGLDAPPVAATGDVPPPSQTAAAPPPPPPPAAPDTVAQPPEKQKTFLDWLIN